ncbi:hypothetical protein HNR50_000952 [Spirochaeta isovalerica]|uniref:Uncharacterized protein n=1 Tax=Spirochaeta isovalerica TaxID=150 RepID=A0A841R8N4_9SPIO|nr:hypothetical protein [Spirochaeta isovalerica]
MKKNVEIVENAEVIQLFSDIYDGTRRFSGFEK